MWNWPDKEIICLEDVRHCCWFQSSRVLLTHVPGHRHSNEMVCSHGDQDGFGTAVSGVIPRHSLINDDCSKWQTLLFFFLYCFNCVPPLAKPGMCKPGLRSERERITPPVDWSTVGNARGGDWVNTSPSSTHQWTSRQNATLLSLLTAAYSDKKKEKHYAEFIPEVPMTTAGLLIVFIVRILLLQYFWSQGKTVPSLLKTLASFCDALIRLLSYEQGYSQVSHIVFQMQLCEACNELPLREKQKRITVWWRRFEVAIFYSCKLLLASTYIQSALYTYTSRLKRHYFFSLKTFKNRLKTSLLLTRLCNNSIIPV